MTENNRRNFLKGIAAVGSLGVFAYGYSDTLGEMITPTRYKEKNPVPTDLDSEAKTVSTLCQACNTRCGIKVRVVDGRAVKINGNPYHPNTTAWEPVKYDTPVSETRGLNTPICSKAQGALQWTYDPFRIKTPLKRAGPRGSGKWKPISWEQLISEVVEGGQLFKEIGEDREVVGFAKARSFDPIDPAKPELGPKANQVIMFRGRGQPGRTDFLGGWMNRVYGSTNFIPHDAVCAIAVQTGHDIVTDFKVEQFRPDIKNAKFILSFGDVYSAGQPSVTPAGMIIPERLKSGDLKLVVIDPRAGNAVAHATKWVPINPRTDGALVMAIIQWVIENKKFNKGYLENPNQKASDADGEPLWTNATHLVIIDSTNANNRKFIRGDELGLTADKDKFVVIDAATGKPQLADTSNAGTLFFDGIVKDKSGKDIKVKSSLQILKEEALKYTLAQYSEITSVPVATIEWIANEFTSYGRRAGLLMYRAPATQYNGTYMVMASFMLQMLIGTIHYKGGYLQATSTAWTTGRYDLTKWGKQTKKGITISREKFKYEDTSEYKSKVAAGQNPYPAQLNWFPTTHGGLWTEAVAGMAQEYPYGAKILMTYMANQIYSLPADHKTIDTFKDPNKLNLNIALDIFITEATMLADYIVPDLTWLEGNMGIMNPYPPNHAKFNGVRVPAIEPMTGKTSEGIPFSTDQFLIDVAKKMKIEGGVGADVIPGPDKKTFPLNRAEDFYFRAIVNLAYNGKVPNASDEEVRFVEENYPASFVSYAKSIFSDEEWRKMVYVIARGGFFEDPAIGFTGEIHKYGTKMLLQFYSEKLAVLKQSITGKNYLGTATWIEAKDMKGQSLDEVDKAYPLVMVGYKMSQHTQSRTMYDKLALEMYPENYIEISEDDAITFGLKTGDNAKVESASDSVVGPIKVTKRIKPGVIAISHHYGHWAWNSSDVEVENASQVGYDVGVVKGNIVVGDASRGKGVWGSKIMRIDDFTKSALVDPIAGCSPTGGVRVKLTKA
ncbi:MAG TPA: molybdopterin-dependent oxidoreductase [Nitrososphaerales archaeon]